MLQTKKFDFRAIQLIAYLGGGSLLMALFCTLFPVKLPLFFSALPLFVAYLSFGATIGGGASLLASIVVLLLMPLEGAVDLILNMFAPAALLGYLSIRSITKGRKTWWYPESFMLRDFMLLSLGTVVFLSYTFRTEQTMTELSRQAMNLLMSDGKNVVNTVALQQYLQAFVKYSVGLGGITKMLLTILNFHLAYMISKRMKKNIRPSFDLTCIRITNWMILLPLVSLTLSYVLPQFAFALCGVFVVSLFAPIFSGLSLLHYFYMQKHKRRILIAYYLALFMMPIPILFGTALIGIIDGLYPIRGRINLR